jgi:acetyl esterase/lipase
MRSYLTRDIAYGPGARQKLDVYRPSRPVTPATTIIFWHGGSWRAGDKRSYHFMGRALASLGFTAVLANYRLLPQAGFADMLADAAATVRWAHQELEPARLVVMGHSAGAHIAAVLALDPRHLAASGLTPAAIAGFIGLAGPYDFDHSAGPRPAMSVRRPQNWQPIDMVDSAGVPMLLLQGGRDRVLAPANAPRLAAAVRAAGGQADVLMFDRLGHMTLLLPFIVRIGWWPAVEQRLSAFVSALSTTASAGATASAPPPAPPVE